MAEVCAWHKTSDCMDKTGVLILQQSMTPPADRDEFDMALASVDRVVGTSQLVRFSTELGSFCTMSALLSWLESSTGAMRQTTATLHGPGPGSSRHRSGQRPTVYRKGTRRQR